MGRTKRELLEMMNKDKEENKPIIDKEIENDFNPELELNEEPFIINSIPEVPETSIVDNIISKAPEPNDNFVRYTFVVSEIHKEAINLLAFENNMKKQKIVQLLFESGLKNSYPGTLEKAKLILKKRSSRRKK